MGAPLTNEDKKKIALGVAIISFIIALVILIFLLPGSEDNASGEATGIFSWGAEEKTEDASPKCPSDCADDNECTIDYCNSETNYTCKHVEIKSVECRTICPEDCDDGLDYTKDYCSSKTNYTCKHEDIRECAGDLCWIEKQLEEINVKVILKNEIIFINKEPIKFINAKDIDYDLFALKFRNLINNATAETVCSTGDIEIDCKAYGCKLEYLNSTKTVTFNSAAGCRIYEEYDNS